MAPGFFDIVEEARLSARALWEYGDHFFHPTVRLGGTGLSRAGKTVFITALIHGLTRGGRFPIFEPFATGRIARARLEPQPDDAVPRFDYENHVRTLIEERRWPNSTVDISELRLAIDYQRQNGADRTLTLDIVDYPGEWLLDLPLLNKSYQQWSRESLGLSRERPRARLAAQWHSHLATLNAQAREDEQAALTAARMFTDYLRACRDERFAMSLLPPGRFLMPGNLAGSPGCSGRCAGGLQLGTGSAARPRSSAGGNSGLLQDRPQHLALEFVPAADRPHLVCRNQGRSPAPFEPRSARGGVAADRDQGRVPRRRHRRRHRRRRAGRGPRHPRGPGATRPRQIAVDPRHTRLRRDRGRRSLRRQHRGRHLSGRSAGRSGTAVQG